MRNGILTLLFLLAGAFGASAQALHPKSDLYSRLQQLSAVNLNINTPTPVDSLVQLCRQNEAFAQKSGDLGQEFKAGQILVNSFALTGSQALAANKAQQMAHDDRIKNNPIAMGLAMQAIGDTYMFSGRFAQADSVLHEASHLIERHGDAYMRAELLLQQLHVHLTMQRTASAVEDIARMQALLSTTDTGAGGATYRLLLESYQALAAIQLLDAVGAKQYLANIAHERPADGSFDLWYYYLQAQYNTLEEEFEDALAYSDSTLIAAKRGHNGNILRQAMASKALLLEKIGNEDEACVLYRQISELADSLRQTQYITQIDSLHVTYLIDQLQMSNLVQRNKLYTKVILGLLGLGAITLVVILLVRNRNRKLQRSHRELKALREASEESLRIKSLFLSNMSHELRTPLNALTGFSTLLTGDEEPDDQMRRQYSEYISQNAELLLKLISDVVDLSELKHDSLRFTYASCEVVALCRNVIKTVDNVKRTRARIIFETELEQLEIITDHTRLQQVLINLLINATKFTPEGTITLRLRYDQKLQKAEFSVEDTGCGIPAEKQNSIFERYEKLHEGVQGTGLGLSICQLIVNHTGGSIWIDPNYTQGARFVFTHPANPQNTQAR